MKIFVDANIFVALANKNDSTHQRANKLLAKLEKENPQLFTSSDVVKEAATIISQRIDHKSAVKFLNEIESGDITIIFVDYDLNQKGLQEFGEQTSKNVSCVDAISFIIMEQFNMDYAFSFDRDFRKSTIKILS